MTQGPVMHRDPLLRRRNALVIPGTLLVVFCLAGMVYAQILRSDDVTCGDGTQVVFAGACRSATLLLAIPFAIGALLLGAGLTQRSKVTCSLGHGTGSATVLALLVSLFTLPFLAAIGLYLMQDAADPYVLTFYEVDFTLVRILAAVATVFLVVLVPYLGLYMATARPPKCCRARECFEPCFCDEEEAAPAGDLPPVVPTFADTPPVPAEAPPEASTAWPAPPPPPAPAPLPPPEPAPAPAPEPVAEPAAPAPAAEERRSPGKPAPKAAKKTTRTVTRKTTKSSK